MSPQALLQYLNMPLRALWQQVYMKATSRHIVGKVCLVRNACVESWWWGGTCKGDVWDVDCGGREQNERREEPGERGSLYDLYMP